MARTPRAEVVAHSVQPSGAVIVTVTCPNGCKAGPRRDSKPKTHTHGWTRVAGEDGGERAAHCLNSTRGYSLHWAGGPPPEAVAALERLQRA